MKYINKLTDLVIAFALLTFAYFAIRYDIDRKVDERLDDYHRTLLIEQTREANKLANDTITLNDDAI